MEYLAARLDDEGIAYQSPVGGHGVFVDAAAMFPNIPYYEQLMCESRKASMLTLS